MGNARLMSFMSQTSTRLSTFISLGLSWLVVWKSNLEPLIFPTVFFDCMASFG
ncbi:predicted protein [Sclerotinia sclerotiorum 1980 UF-70]|uniref:Uncharacterized protein n=1 Tax=Sclerotinia sclerotiorum (strain ATCC 18683 / 1980 / Ss-1) TaxID=665079 RepID=A7EGR1_SCLS1|nr:predicted protein [Sclerotinia sclerotiorum 1980 UF-70]EDO02027.1 predicted protein [Sclerotinia sclerotiorum 1980 UF-70]